MIDALMPLIFEFILSLHLLKIMRVLTIYFIVSQLKSSNSLGRSYCAVVFAFWSDKHI